MLFVHTYVRSGDKVAVWWVINKQAHFFFIIMPQQVHLPSPHLNKALAIYTHITLVIMRTVGVKILHKSHFSLHYSIQIRLKLGM